MDGKPYIETAEKMGEFTARILRNKHIPARFKEQGPLTVIQFSLTNEIRDSLAKALRLFQKHGKSAEMHPAELAQIVENHFPPQVLDYFRALNPQDPEHILPHVYNVKNLFEKADNREWDTLTELIGKGFAHATGLQRSGGSLISRTLPKVGRVHVSGDELHKHNVTATMLNGISESPGTRSPTRFVDLVGAASDHRAEEAEIGKMLSAEKEQTYHSRTANTPPENLPPYSQDVHIEPGDMVIWSEFGRVFHQGMPTDFGNSNIEPGKEFRTIRYHNLVKPPLAAR